MRTILLFGPSSYSQNDSSEDRQQSATELTRRVEDLEWKLEQLNSTTSELNKKVQNYDPIMLVFFLYAGFCALWAQNTNRNPWLWFFAGFLFSVIAVVTLLIKNRDDRVLRK